MTMFAMYKICSRCKRKYAWNPDVGKFRCPYCGLSGLTGFDISLWDKSKKVIVWKKDKYIEK